MAAEGETRETIEAFFRRKGISLGRIRAIDPETRTVRVSSVGDLIQISWWVPGLCRCEDGNYRLAVNGKGQFNGWCFIWEK